MKRFIRVYGSGSGSVRHPGLKYVIAFGKWQSGQCISYINSQYIRADLIFCSKTTTKHC